MGSKALKIEAGDDERDRESGVSIADLNQFSYQIIVQDLSDFN